MGEVSILIVVIAPVIKNGNVYFDTKIQTMNDKTQTFFRHLSDIVYGNNLYKRP